MLQKIIGERTGKILDIGCGKGLLLNSFQKDGWEAVGIELSQTSARYARETLGLEVYSKNFEECKFNDNAFDVITFFHSLEHLKDPASALRKARNLLTSNGFLVVQVPRFNSFYAKIFRDKWFHLDVPRHLFHFSDNTLSVLMNKSGFHTVKKQKFILMHDAFGALQSILNMVCSQYNLLNDVNTKRLEPGKIMRSGSKRLKADLIVSILGQGFFFPPLYFFAALLSIFNIGGTLTFFSQKNSIHHK
jgi:SAM-dependent methyltransferase